MSAAELSCDDPEPPRSNLTLLFNIDTEVDAAKVPSSESITAWALHTVQGVPDFDSNSVYEVSVVVVSAPQIQALNRQYRNKNKPTNVLSFPSSMPPIPATVNLADKSPGKSVDKSVDKSGRHYVLGDIVLCQSVIEAEANDQQKNVAHHWAHMVVHSVLHLFDYDHELHNAAQAMESLEVTLLQGLSISNPYQLPFQSNE